MQTLKLSSAFAVCFYKEFNMKKVVQYSGLGMALLAIVLLFSKPTEAEFFEKIVEDYSQVHPEFSLSAENLKEMGSTKYSSMLVYSTYAYQFGNIEVRYLGIFGGIYNLGYEKEEDTDNEKESTPVIV
ncbi:MAG: hypothetical protein ACJAV5_001122 [Vicingaceae bacterium]|jgi:hypothetical protein